MIDDNDILRAAAVMIDQYGFDAISQAELRTVDTLSRGEVEGHLVWNRILAAVRDLLWERGEDPLH